MATATPALRGEFGSFEYFLTTMHVGELVKSITIPREMDDWESMSLEERYQRDININRVRREIAPYFAGDENRFSSALILAVRNDEGMKFEPLNEVVDVKRIPGLYRTASNNIGFLIRDGGEVLVPLDGQHRAKAFKFAIDGQDDKGRPIVNGKGEEISNTTLAADEVAVILVRFDTEGSRRIFNKVNQYAKPTGRGQNLITADDDAIAVISRRMISDDGLIPAELVRWQSNTLSAKAPEFTTLATWPTPTKRSSLRDARQPENSETRMMPSRSCTTAKSSTCGTTFSQRSSGSPNHSPTQARPALSGGLRSAPPVCSENRSANSRLCAVFSSCENEAQAFRSVNFATASTGSTGRSHGATGRTSW